MTEALPPRSDAVRVAHGRRGRGVFATRAIEGDEVVELCPTVRVPRDSVSGRLADYVFDCAEDADSVVLGLGYAMLYNHSSDPNVVYDQVDGTLEFSTTRRVEPGEELTIDYGAEWWSDRGQEPLPE